MFDMSDLLEIEAAVFDMDGLLLDSERIALATFIDACRDCGFEPDVDVYYKCIGSNEDKTRQILMEGYGESYPFVAVDELWHSRYEEESISRPFPLKPGVVEILRMLKKSGIKMACATSTRHDSAERKLDNAGLLGFFDFIIGGDEIVKCKPDPEMYLKACQKLKVDPQNCLAFEDSDNGVISAVRAGMQVIQVPDLCQPSEQVRELGHVIVESLVEAERLLLNTDIYSLSGDEGDK